MPWLDRQRLSLKAVAAHLTRLGHGDTIDPILAKGERLDGEHRARLAAEREESERQREAEIRRWAEEEK